MAEHAGDAEAVPTLILDAILNPELLRPYWPQVEMTADLRVQTPHMAVRQVIDRAFSKAMLEPLDAERADADAEEARRRRRNLRNLRAILFREARRYAPQRVLIVLQKAIEEALLELGPLPPNIELEHHNNLAGRDEWGPQPHRPGVALLIVVGRTLPGPGAVSRIAEALTGSAVDLLEPWYERADAARFMADGSAVTAEGEQHPDPLTEAIRWQICEGELIQAIGRPRGVNRTAENPVDVLVLTDVPLPLPLAGTLSAAELTPDPRDLMLAEGGIAFENARHAATAYPNIWPNWEAARKALSRAGNAVQSGTFPYCYIPIGECPTLEQKPGIFVRVDYQAAGARARPSECWIDPFVVPDPASALEARLGPLVAPGEL